MTRNSQFLEKFSEQIATWATTLCSQGTLPFRRIERERRLLTEQGWLTAPLVLWINRDSYLAGGVIFFPDRETSATHAAENAVAAALGLGCFAVWEQNRIAIFQAGAQVPPEVVWHLDSPRPSANDFKAGLRKLLEALKLRSVTHTVPPARLSVFAPANLGLQTLADLGVLSAGGDPATESPQTAQIVLILCQLLYALHCDALPAGLQPEGIIRALKFHLGQFPAGLEILAADDSDPLPPPRHAIRLHNLWHRLRQLLPGMPAGTLTALARLLLNQLAPAMEEIEELPPDTGLVSFNIPGLVHPTLRCEIAPRHLLALAALLRHLEGVKVPAQLRSIWSPKPLPIHHLQLVRLSPAPPPDRTDRQRFATLLRTAWPNRRPALPATSPAWLWETLHMLGQLPDGGSMRGHIPSDWLHNDFGVPLWQIICEEFTLLSLQLTRETACRIELQRGIRGSASTLHGPAGCNRLPWRDLRLLPLSWVRLLLHLPAGTFRLCRENILVPADRLHDPSRYQEAIEPYLLTPLGVGLLRFFNLTRLPTDPEAACRTLRKAEFPLPSETALQRLEAHLQQIPGRSGHDPLQVLFGPGMEIEPPVFPDAKPGDKPGRIPLVRTLEGQFRNLLNERTPEFPEQYLYRYSSDQLKTIAIPAGLGYRDTFFGRVVLSSTQGELELETRAEAACLLFAAKLGYDEIRIPLDPDATTEVFDRYWEDLLNLRRELEKLASGQGDSVSQATRLAQKLWNSHPHLPPWGMLASRETLFSS